MDMVGREVVYVGGGYVGLTGAVQFAKNGMSATIYDTDHQAVQAINLAQPRGEEFLSYMHADLRQLLFQEKLRATSDLSTLMTQRNFIVAVPSERQGRPWMEPVRQTVKKIVHTASDPPLICIESTLTPGTARSLVDLLRADFKAEVGKDYFLAVCPRKDWFADQEKNLATLPRVVGGMTPACTERAVRLLSRVSREIHETDATTAEFTKSIENGLFHTAAMFAYELALAFPSQNMAEAVRLACLHWRLPKLHLGFGAGGRCVPLGNLYLRHALENFSAIEELREAEVQLPIATEALRTDAAFRARIALFVHNYGLLHPNTRTAILGIGYRPDFRDAGLSPGLAIAKAVRVMPHMGLGLGVHDPLWTEHEVSELFEMPYAPLPELPNYDLILLATPHTLYKELPTSPLLWREGQVIVDAQGAWREHRELFAARGVQYRQVGEPLWLGIPDSGEEQP